MAITQFIIIDINLYFMRWESFATDSAFEYKRCKNIQRKPIHHMYDLFFTDEIGHSSSNFRLNKNKITFYFSHKNKVNDA